MNKLVTGLKSFWSVVVALAAAAPKIKAAAATVEKRIREKAEDIINVLIAFAHYYAGMALLGVEVARSITSVADALKSVPASAKTLGNELDEAVKKLVPTPQRAKRAYKKTGKSSKRTLHESSK